MSKIHPTDIRLHKKSRLLEIHFEDGAHFELSCELLRVYSPSAEVRGHRPEQAVLQLGKESVTIEAIKPIGNYAVKLYFDDGHNSGIYSWDLLYRLGENRDVLWQEYLQQLAAAGHKRTTLHAVDNRPAEH